MVPNLGRFSALRLVLLSFLVLGVFYALSTPPFEASDEYKHYPVAQYVQDHLSLPILEPESPVLWLQEAVQPPLYYLLMGLATSWIDTSDLLEVYQVNPHAFISDPNQIGNKKPDHTQSGQRALPSQRSANGSVRHTTRFYFY